MAKLENDAGNELHSLMGMLELSADRLLRTIQNIARLAGQGNRGLITDFDLTEIVGGVTTLMQVIAESKGVSLTCDVSPRGSCGVKGDKECLEDILFRILDNAVS